MAVFTGTSGRKFPLVITLRTVRRLKTDLGIDLLTAGKATYDRLLGDIETLVDALCIFAQDAIRDAGLSAEEFADEIGGEQLAEAETCVTGGLIEFFTKAGRPESATTMVEAVKVMIATREEQARQIEQADLANAAIAEVQKTGQTLRSTLGSTSGTSPEKPASTGETAPIES